MELAIAGAAQRDRIRADGWTVTDAHTISATMEDYAAYLARSRGEVSIAKNAYVASRSGWFSTRSAAYLASGKPVVLQDTAWSAHLPVGAGLHPFTTLDEAVQALADVRRDYG